MSSSDTPQASALPAIRRIGLTDLKAALRAGWQDFAAAPAYGAFFGGFYVICGIALFWLTQATGQVYWLALAVFGFPLIGPFAAVGLYEVSHRLEQGTPLVMGEILSVVWHQRARQLPSLCAILIFIFLFWSFIGHMIFALFLGLQTMTNISSSYEVFLTTNGLGMLAVGTIVGAILAGIVFAISVMGLPMLLDLEIDFITAMIHSFQTCLQNFRTMAIWGLIVTVLLVIGMAPMFMGLLVVLPVLGHASWHLYRRALD
ncbi:hypothetical protein ATO10_01385 [Actibacterium atlanticum]|uniref:Integral membrane protein n=1 Tax=Actibacterium atlanticum TaxID=1461693 RepID=A0A058ZQC6_9RHOB|nr:DUF2189 domain-containing protein [Actibacterium atlanticum]KCV83372.1 hypothetical protein ATO10_01385 [Actibacterium atlanticum]